MNRNLSRRLQKSSVWILIGIVSFLIFLSVASGFIVKWLWMGQLGYEAIFWRLFTLRLVLFALALGVAFFFSWFNLRRAVENSRKAGGKEDFSDLMKVPAKGKTLILPVSFLFAVIFGLVFSSQWDTVLRFQWGGAIRSSRTDFQPRSRLLPLFPAGV
jgi:uncharacterized protein